MTTNRSYRCPTNNIRLSNLISLPLNNINNSRTNSPTSYYVSMMTWHHSRRNLPRPPHTPSTKRTTIRNNLIYYLRSILLPRILLSILPLEFSTYPRTRWMLTSHRNHPPRPIWSAPSQHSCTISIRGYSYMSPPQHYRRGTKTSYSIPSINHSTWTLLYCSPSYGILWSTLHNCRRSIWLNILCSYRIPWTPCYYWINLPSSMPSTPNPIPLYIRTPFRLWSRCLILTLCRRSMTIPLRVYLLMRLIIFLVLKLVQVTSNHTVLVKPQGKIMNLIITILTITAALSLILATISFWLPQINPDAEKLSPYECGFDPLGSARLPFSLRFFLVAILFLLFDLEIALLLPLPWGDQLNNPTGTFFWATTVLILLTLGLIYEWTQGGLEWAE